MMVLGRILVVDDHIDLAENLAEILGRAGVQTVTAPSAEAGLLVIEAGGIVGLITDYRLPGRNGAQLISELRSRGNGIPAVVMSAYTDDDTVRDARAAGAMRVLAKPVDLEQLMVVVRALSEA
jgi:DNA-binding NtrC family response regulator